MRALIRTLAVIVAFSVVLAAGQRDDRAEILLQAAVQKELVEGDLRQAIRLYTDITANHGGNRPVVARALVYMGRCYEKLGAAEAQKLYEQVLREYGDQSEAATEARTRLAALGRKSGPTSGGGLMVRRALPNALVSGVSGLSSDGRYISDPDWETGNLLVIDVSTGQKRRLTNKASVFESEEFAYFSAFSPDDKQVAYVWFSKAGRYELRVTAFDGSQTRVVYDDEETSYIPFLDWSPDGKSLLAILSRKGGTNQIALVPAAGGRPRVLKTLDWRYPLKMCFSPDGRYIAYDFPPKEDAPERDIFALAVDGSREVPLVQHPAHDFAIGWAPDGKRFLFGSDRRGTIGVWIVAVQDGKPAGAPELFRPDLGPSLPVRVTPAGSYYYGVQFATNDVYVATLDPTMSQVVVPPVPPVERSDSTNKWPEWSPDGKELAYASQNLLDGSERPLILRIHALDTGKEREIVPRLSFFSRLRWSPDGRSLLVNGNDDRKRGGLFRIDAQTGEAIMVVRSAGMPRQSAWFRDGRTILYWDLGSGGPILKRDLETGSEQQVHPGADFALSPDNRWLVVRHDVPEANSNVLKLVPLDGGASRELTQVRGSGAFWGDCSWAPDSRHVLCTKAPAAGRSELWRLSIDQEPPHRVLVRDDMMEIRVNPDGRRIAFSAGSGTTELWVMENFVAPLPNRARREKE